MKKLAWILFIGLGAKMLWAQPQIVATYPYIGDLIRQVGQERVQVKVLASGDWDPHVVIPKPSFIAHLRQAEGLVINGAGGEVGWLPPLIQQAQNIQIQSNGTGHLDLSRFAGPLIQVPHSISREQGHVHPEGNPHFYLDPFKIPRFAQVIQEKLCEWQANDCAYYTQNYQTFEKKWQTHLKDWGERMQKRQGATAISYHRTYDYFLERYDLELIATLEPLPGIPPSARHIEMVLAQGQRAKNLFILQDVYHTDQAARHISRETKAPLLVLPHDVEAVPEATDIFQLFEVIVQRLTHE